MKVKSKATEPTQENEHMDALFKAVGFVVVQWGQAEQSLDLAIGVLYRSFDGKCFAKRLPVMLAPKLSLVEQCLSGTVALAASKDAGLTLVNEFRRLSPLRHDLVHGAISSLAPIDGAFSFGKLDTRGDIQVHREVRLVAEDFPQLTRDLIALGSNATRFARGLFELLKIKDQNKRKR